VIISGRLRSDWKMVSSEPPPPHTVQIIKFTCTFRARLQPPQPRSRLADVRKDALAPVLFSEYSYPLGEKPNVEL
jgi:hypothetical protein